LFALSYLGYRLLKSLNKEEQQTGIALLQEAAEKGDSAAQVYLAISYVYTDTQPDKEHVLYWLNQADQQGDLRASYTLGRLYHSNNGEVVEQDHQKAFEYFEKSYNRGHLASYFIMIRYMTSGKRGFLNRFKGIFSAYSLYKKLSFAVQNNQWEKELYEWDGVHDLFKRAVILLTDIYGVIDITPPPSPKLPTPLQHPPQIENFTGRTEQLSSIINNLQPNKVITLYGAEGIGKTALVAEMVNQLVIDGTQAPEHFPDGIIFYSFDNNSSIESVLLHIANTYHAKEQGESVQQVAQKALDTKIALLILDGTEHIDNDDLQSILDIKGSCGVLITTRDKQQTKTNYQEVKALNIEDAITLLNKSTVDKIDNQETAIQICEELGRLPLAIKLAGHYLSQADNSAIAYLQQLKEHPQPQSIQGFLTRTMAKLADTEQQMLSVFGCLAMKPVPLAALEEVLELSAEQSKKAIQSLINFGLIQVNTDHYEFNHALIHTYAHEKIVLPDLLFTRLLNWYKKFAEEETEKGQQGYSVLDTQQAHLLYLIEQAHQRQQWQAVIDLVWATYDYLYNCDFWQEQKHTLSFALTAAQAAEQHDTEGYILGSLGIVYYQLNKVEKAIDYYQQALIINREINNREREGQNLGNLGNAYADLSEVKKAIDCLQQALTISQEINDRHGEGQYLYNLGIIYADLGKAEKAIDYYQQALAISQETGNQQAEEYYLCDLGRAYKNVDKIEQTIDCYNKAIAINQEVGDQKREKKCLSNLGNIYNRLGESEKAIDCHQQALVISQEVGDRQGEGNHLRNLGNAYFDLEIADADLHQAEKAIEFYHKALVISREIGDQEGTRLNLNNLGAIYEELGELDSARDCYQQALVVAKEIHSSKVETISAHLKRINSKKNASSCRKVLKWLILFIGMVGVIWWII